MSSRCALVLAASLLAAPVYADLASVKSEPNLEKRAEKALDNAQESFKAAQAAYVDKNDPKATEAALQEVVDSVRFAYDSLMATGKNPSRRPKHFKRAEIKTRDLLRRMDDFRAQMSAMDRQPVERARDELHRIHDLLLEGIMGGGRKK